MLGLTLPQGSKMEEHEPKSVGRDLFENGRHKGSSLTRTEPTPTFTGTVSSTLPPLPLPILSHTWTQNYSLGMFLLRYPRPRLLSLALNGMYCLDCIKPITNYRDLYMHSFLPSSNNLHLQLPTAVPPSPPYILLTRAPAGH